MAKRALLLETYHTTHIEGTRLTLRQAETLLEGVRMCLRPIRTISEFYDRDRRDFYRAIQRVREKDMDMTCWVEYFVSGLSSQMKEVTQIGERAIRADVMTREMALNKRQTKALKYMLDNESIEGGGSGTMRRCAGV